MSQLSHSAGSVDRDPAYLLIEDQLDALGQRYRVQRMVRGFALWVGCGIVVSAGAMLLAHVIGVMFPADGNGIAPHHAGAWLRVVLVLWGVWLAGSAGAWVYRPLVMRPRNLEMARLIETRMPGFFNGLTNSVLLAQAADLRESPWLPWIFAEVADHARGQTLSEAVKFSELRRVLLLTGGVAVGALLLAAWPGARQMLLHGAGQMLNPGKFIPAAGSVADLRVEPGDALVIAGQPLEIGVWARAKTADYEPEAKLIFEPAAGGATKETALMPMAQTEGMGGGASLHYGYRMDRVDSPLRYRVEVGGTQSGWYSVKIVQQVKLMELSVVITPPIYTRLPERRMEFKGADIGASLAKTPISVPQGSKIELSAGVDVPVKGAMLQMGESGEAAMTSSGGGERFTGQTTILDQTTLAVLLMEGSQVIARLPEEGVAVQCQKDGPPTIEMQWPAHDVTVAPNAEIKIHAILKDDYGVSAAQILVGGSAGAGGGGAATEQAPMSAAWSRHYGLPETAVDVAEVLEIKPELRKHGQSIHVQVTATDNRDLMGVMKGAAAGAADGGKGAGKDLKDGGPQTTTSAIIEIKFRDPEQILAEEKDKLDQLRAQLQKMLALQKDLNAKSVVFAGDGKSPAKDGKTLAQKVNGGQGDLRGMMQTTAETFSFDDATRIVQKTLQMMMGSVAREAVELSAAMLIEPMAKEQLRQNDQLQGRQRQIISTLESLLAVISAGRDPASQPTVKGSPDMPNQAEKWQKLDEALKAFMKEEQRILDQTASLARKPVDNFDDRDKKLLEELKQSQDKMDAFMQQALSDFSKNAEQDMSNAALLKDLLAVYSEVTMAKDALKQQSAEIAVADEEMGLEGAKEISSNIEKWLSNQPDRQQWTQEDPVGKTDTPMPELPKELEDMVGKLMEEQEDLNQQMEDANANWTDSMDKGVGWDAADGPIADMSAKGVTGNTLPNDNEMAGRSGEGRSGKSQGEFVGDTAQGKGGRNTPTRLDPTPFAKGQIKDESKDPVGGATGGGKMSGQGGAGLEGPVPPKQKQEMQRLADKQAEIRNKAERLQLQYHLGRYDNFNLYESIALMRRSESDVRANRYQNAMRNRNVIVDEMGTSKLLLGGDIHVQQDTTPPSNAKMQEQINDAMKGDMPAAWSEALKEYYKKLAAQ